MDIKVVPSPCSGKTVRKCRCNLLTHKTRKSFHEFVKRYVSFKIEIKLNKEYTVSALKFALANPDNWIHLLTFCFYFKTSPIGKKPTQIKLISFWCFTSRLGGKRQSECFTVSSARSWGEGPTLFLDQCKNRSASRSPSPATNISSRQLISTWKLTPPQESEG